MSVYGRTQRHYYADALVAVHNSSPGTADMIRRMRAAGKPVHEVRETPLRRRMRTQMKMIDWVIPDRLARGHRPGYEGGRRGAVAEPVITAWCNAAWAAGVRSILCLLAREQLDLYAELPGGLLVFYRASGFTVAHVPVADHKWPPLSDAELRAAWEAFRALPGPVLVHCSAGIDRTGAAVEHIVAKLKDEEVPEA